MTLYDSKDNKALGTFGVETWYLSQRIYATALKPARKAAISSRATKTAVGKLGRDSRGEKGSA